MAHTDILIIGSGIAGLLYSLELSEKLKITIICKKEPFLSNTRFAQGGIASVTSRGDSFESHVRDTLVAGDGLCNETIVKRVIQSGPECIQQLVNFGVTFDKVSGAFELGKEGGHSERRILHSGDSTGVEILRALTACAQARKNITFLKNHVAVDLIVNHSLQTPAIAGVHILNEENLKIDPIYSSVTMLATGGAGKVYLYTSNPDVATGDGIAMAYRAGAKVANMEFFQFHPTCLYDERERTFLITEAMRGEGAKLLDISGEAFMHRYDSRGELAPRDIVARAIDDHMKKTGTDYVLLDISHREPNFIKERFPTIYKTTKELGFDITVGPIPVVPAAHYCCGGVVSDEHGRTNLDRLYVAGESASTGLHGANRLASNSLLEAIYFAKKAAEDTNSSFTLLPASQENYAFSHPVSTRSREDVLISHTWDEVRRLMWNLVGIVRSDRRLALAKKRITAMSEEVSEYFETFPLSVDLIELRNITLIAELIISCANMRKESRGLHYNLDHPKKDDKNWLRDSVLCYTSNASEPIR